MANTPDSQNNKYNPPILRTVREYPAGDEASHEVLMALAEELGLSMIIEPKDGLILPDLTSAEKTEELVNKIVVNLTEARDRIDAAKSEGKHVLYLPGSYDLVHKGHAFYVQQAIEAYVEHSGAAREDVFVVMLADDDALIAEVKAGKYVGNGGSEPSPRPVEPAHQRALGMAAVPDVAVVGFLPSPKVASSFHPAVPELDIDMIRTELETMFVTGQQERLVALGLEGEKLEKAQKQISVDLADLRNMIAGYETMYARSEAGLRLCPEDVDVEGMDEAEVAAKIDELKAELPGYSIKAKKNNDGRDVIAINIPVQPWQMYTAAILNGVTKDNMGQANAFTAGNMTRLVSLDDSKYLGQVVLIAVMTGIGIGLIADKNIGSTTTLLENAVATHPDDAWDAVRAHKAAAIDETLGEEARHAHDVAARDLARRMAAVDEA